MNNVREFKKIRTIGTGGQGIVWEATSPSGELVAYKIYNPDPNSSSPRTDRKRFEKEIRTQSTLNHKNIVQVIENGEDVNGNPFYIMDLSNGSLQNMINDNPGGLPRDESLDIFEKICTAMAYAHSQHVLHRDLKPSNILMYEDGPRVADFGLGRDISSNTKTYTQSRTLQGSIGYMPSEQLESLHSAEEPADVFALGKILYCMLTGSNPLIVDLSKIPDDLQYFILTCTQDRADDRYTDCGEALNGLLTILNADSSTLAPPTEQAKAALTAHNSGDTEALSNLIEILLSYPNDSALYTKFAANMPRRTLINIAKHHQTQAKLIVGNFASHSETNTVFDFADKIADFFIPFFRNIEDPNMRRTILTQLLHQGYRNNRYYVGDIFAKMCDSVWSKPIYASMIADILKKNPTTVEFSREYLKKYSIPPTVESVIRTSE